MKIVILGPILTKISQMTLLTDANFNALQLCFHNFFNWRTPKSKNCKKRYFFQKTRKRWFFAICGCWASPIKKMIKSKVEEHQNRHQLVVSFVIFFLLKLAEKCQNQKTRKLDASTPLYYPATMSFVQIYLAKKNGNIGLQDFFMAKN